MQQAYIIRALRTPVGKLGGVLSNVRSDDLMALMIKSITSSFDIPADQIDEVIVGCANQAGEDNRNVARMSLLLAGLPHSVPGVTVNRLCGSGLEAINIAARMIQTEDAHLVLAGGVENMSRAPWVFPKPTTGFANGNITAYDTSLGWRFPNPKMEAMFPLEAMGETAENLVEKYGISREAQDRFAYESHQKAIAAQQNGFFKDEIIPVSLVQKKGEPLIIEKDEGPRSDTTLEKLTMLKPAFRKNGTVTAGNSSSLNDGASCLLIASEFAVKKYHFTPIARYIGSATAGVDPRYMGIGPVEAVNKLLKKTGISKNSIDLIELNEAFAAQSLSVIRLLDLDPQKINVHGGAIALGHPLGCSGARITTTLLHAMKKNHAQIGLASLCIGVGQGIAALFESCV